MLEDPYRFEMNINDLTMQALRHELMYTGSRDEISLKSLMFQTGYLTMTDYDPSSKLYTLKFPNQEIKEAFQQSLKDSFARGGQRLFFRRKK